VNSCTLTSKQIRKRLIYSILLVVLMMMIVDGVLYYIIDSRTTKHSFVEEKQSKIKHFNLNYKDHRDIVFIGNSRTIFHISSKIFKDNSLDIYNFGVSGNALVDYPAYVINAISQQPKMIVLNLALEDLYTPVGKASNPSFSDILFYKNLGDEKLLLANIYQWFFSYHMIFNYSEALVLKIKLLYDRLEPIQKNTTNMVVPKPKNEMDYDCSPFIIQRYFRSKTIIKCKNGDGVLVGNIDTLPIRKPKVLKYINKTKVNILKNLVKKMNANNIQVMVIFEPILYSQYHIVNDLENDLEGINFLNLSEYSLDKKFIVDAGHFNVYGRDIYSRYLAAFLKGELND